MVRQIVSVCVLALFVAPLAVADNWPAWRGPSGQGFCEEKNVPVKWSEKENVKWKITLADQGNSTPVVWGERIFLTQANKGGHVRSIMCFDRADGKKLWQNDVAYPDKERNWTPLWYANASPTTDGERIVVSFGSAGVYCYDVTGKELWKRTDLGTWEHSFGNAASPLLYGDLAIQWCGPNDGKGKNILLAVDKKTGKTVWEKEQKAGSWNTPVIFKIDGKDQMLLAMGETLKSFDPKTGDEFWHCKGMTSYCYAAPLYANGIAVGMSGYGGAAIGVKLGGSDDITKDQLWRHPKNTQRVGSGMLIGDHVYMVDENGTPRCYIAKTGEEIWKVEKRPSAGNTWGSMIHAEGRLYILMRTGETLILDASPKYNVVGINHLGKGEQTNSSLAVSNGDIFIRTFRHLYCIGGNK
ncbi:MAG: serine/threonine protein kinase [Gemmataceae bacterium]|nr:serine/threonine protein kinase [Gemmataceae bacterium]